ncbi:hypothetical protein, partial [Citrobacter portucalensis]
GKNSLNRLIRCVCGKKIGPDPRNFNQRVSLGRNDLLIRTFPNLPVLMTWRIINRRHQLLLETEDREEALRFINRGYRICTTEQWQKVIRVGGKKVINECTVYFVRGGGRSKGNVE